MAEPKRVPDRSAEFHLEEFKALKDEISGLVKTMSAYLIYAVTLSGALYGWLFANTEGRIALLQLSCVIPLAGSIALALWALANLLRINQMGRYIRTLESKFVGETGWELFLARQPRIVLPAAALAWLILIGGNVFVVYQAYSHPELFQPARTRLNLELHR